MDRNKKWPMDGYSEEEVEGIEKIKHQVQSLDESEMRMFLELVNSAPLEMFFAEGKRSERMLRYVDQAKMWIDVLKQIGRSVEGDPEVFVKKTINSPGILSMILQNQGIIDLSIEQFDEGLNTLIKETEYDKETNHPSDVDANYETAIKASDESAEGLVEIPTLIPVTSMPSSNERGLTIPPLAGIQNFLVTRGKKSSPTVREKELANVLNKAGIVFENRLKAAQAITLADIYGGATELKEYGKFFGGELDERKRTIAIMNHTIQRRGVNSPVANALRERLNTEKRYMEFIEKRAALHGILAVGKARMESVNNPSNLIFFEEVDEIEIRRLVNANKRRKREMALKGGRISKGQTPKERMMEMALKKKEEEGW